MVFSDTISCFIETLEIMIVSRFFKTFLELLKKDAKHSHSESTVVLRKVQ